MTATVSHFFSGQSARRRPVTWSRIRKIYDAPESFTDLLPWAEYLPEHQAFALADGRSVGAFFEIRPAATDGQNAEYLGSLCARLQDLITDAVPEEDPDPWVLQLFVQDDPSLEAVLCGIRDETDPALLGSPFTAHYLETLKAHLARVGSPAGLFEDRVTGGRWRGRRRRVRAVVYRRMRHPREAALPLAELNDVCVRIMTALAAAGVTARRGDGRMLYEWLLPWFNPRPSLGDGDPYRLLERMPYPGDEDLPFGRDLADALLLSPPRSDGKSGVWWLDGMPQRCVTVQGLRRAPEPGHYTAERALGDQAFALFDQMPEGTVLTVVIVFRPQYQVLNHIARIVRAAIGEGAESLLARETGEVGTARDRRGRQGLPPGAGLLPPGPGSREPGAAGPPAPHAPRDPRHPADRGPPRSHRPRCLHQAPAHELRAPPRPHPEARPADLREPHREPPAALRALHRDRARRAWPSSTGQASS